MSIVVEPAWDEASESGGRPSLHWIIKDTTGAALSHPDARAALLDDANTPATYGGLNRTTRPELKRLTDSIWFGQLDYGPPPNGAIPTGEFEVSFDISGQSQRINQSLATINTYAAPGHTAPDFKGAINVTRDGVQGAEIIVPQFSYQRTWYVTEATVTAAWIANRANLVGTVSSTSLFGIGAAGEMLMTGFAGTARPSEEDWAITMRWARRENLTNQTVGEITGINQDGWDFLWIHHIDEEDDTAKMIVRRAISAYVERVYRRLDHAALLPA